MAGLLSDLDSRSFPTRERAMRRLSALGRFAEPALRRTMTERPALEVRARAEILLSRLEGAGRSGEELQALRAVEVLEMMGTPAARQVLEGLARGAADCELTREAKELSDTSVDELWRGRLHIELRLLAELSKQIDQLDQKLDDLASEDDRIKLLQSVPGVGPRLSETLVAHIDDPHRFRTAAQVASYAGLVPKQMESGTVKRSGRITRRARFPIPISQPVSPRSACTSSRTRCT